MNTRLLAPAALLAALAMTGCATTGPGYGYGQPSTAPGAACYDCGTVTRIEQGSRVPTQTGAVVGGIVGAVAARELAKNETDSKGRQNTATVAGAAAGAVAGNAIQNRTGMSYNVHVRMQDGRQVVVSQGSLDGIREGSYVEVRNGRAYLR
ncbi:MAG: glycine zipper 2TM domain-containing protein [Pseudoxanthomonas suwonensis]|nr:glycine zipper 2TM domain-containing protein [Pseudoxanthomonas suwonensis]